MRTWILGTAVLLVAAGCGSDHNAKGDAGDDGGSGTTGGGSATNGGNGNGGTGSGSGGSGTVGGSGGTGATVGDGTQLAMCMTNADCDPGLGCYTYGRYCSKTCAADGDCTSLGANYGCYTAPGAGGMMGFPGGMMGFPGGMMGAGTGGMTAGSGGAPAAGTGGAGAATASGVCRASCMDAMDTSCPTGLMCLNVGGNFRCGYPQTMGGTGGTTGGTGGMMGPMMQTPGTTPVFDQCMGGGCLPELTCSSRRGMGFCTQTCMSAADCTEKPDTGKATVACGRAGRCTLSCIEGETDACPTGMTCRAGFGMGPGGGDADGGAMGTCNY